jgi:hypothetical protein
VNVGPFVVADAQAAKLIQPGKCPFDDPTPAPEATARLGAAHRDQWENPTDSQAVADRFRVVAAIGDDAIRSTPRSAAFALEWRNCIHSRASAS